MRLGVYTDYPYHRVNGTVYAERAFALFLARLATQVSSLAVIGRLDPAPSRARYELGERVELVPLPYYASLSDPLPAFKGMAGSLSRFWRALASLDCVWLLGPHPLAFPFAVMARLRRKRVILGVRQNSPEYVRNRHPGRRVAYGLALAMEWGFRLLARFTPTVVVGPAIAHSYRRSRRLLEISVSLVERRQLVEPATALKRDYSGELVALSVGRLDPEKNPLMLADVLAQVREVDPRWRLVVCGEGTQAVALDERLRELGVAEWARQRGYLPHHGGLGSLYRDSHALLHVSWTEGLPQVLFEAFAAGLPVVATDVGGIAAATGSAVSLVQPGDPGQAARALEQIGRDAGTRARLVEEGHALASQTTLDAETARVSRFIEAD